MSTDGPHLPEPDQPPVSATPIHGMVMLCRCPHCQHEVSVVVPFSPLAATLTRDLQPLPPSPLKSESPAESNPVSDPAAPPPERSRWQYVRRSWQAFRQRFQTSRTPSTADGNATLQRRSRQESRPSPLVLAIAVIVLAGMIGISAWWPNSDRDTHAHNPTGTAPTTVNPAGSNPLAAGESRSGTASTGLEHPATQHIIATLSGYNAAETEAGMTLSITPLLPYLDPAGPLLERRMTSLTARSQSHAPHQTMLVRWAIGSITVDGETATVVTQETWSNQEQHDPGPSFATVRVTYTLRYDAQRAQWLIVDSEHLRITSSTAYLLHG